MARLLLSIPRNEFGRHAEKYQLAALDHFLQVCIDYRDKGIVGVDLTGKEKGFPPHRFAAVFKLIAAARIPATIHAGETDAASSVRDAIELLAALRIGHGIRVLDDPATVELAKARAITFEVCPTSNVLLSTVRDYQSHPIRAMLDLGLNVTVNTDNPALFGLTLSREYQALLAVGLMSWREVVQTTLCAARASFLPESEKERLINSLERDPVAGLQNEDTS